MIPEIPRDLALHPGPFASVYLDVSRDHQEAEHEIRLRADALADRLGRAGAPAATVEAAHRAAVEPHSQPGGAGRAVFAAGGEVVHRADLPAPPRREIGRWSWLPHLLPLLAQLPRRVPVVVAQVDRTEARITGIDRAGRPELGTRDRGRQHPAHKVRGGGPAHLSLQRRTEELWADNAREFAAEVDRAVARLRAELVVLTGDVRARALVRDALGERSRSLVEEITGPGPADTTTDEDHLAEEERLAARRAAQRTADLVADFEIEAGRHSGLTADGLAPVVRALQRGQAATVYLTDDPSSDRELWVGPEPAHLATTRAELDDLDAPVLGTDRADAAIVRAVAGTGADLVLLPHPEEATDPRRAGSAAGGDEPRLDRPAMTEGIGALLRFRTQS